MSPHPPKITVAFASFANEEGGITGGEGMQPWIQQTQTRGMSRMKYVSP